MFTRSSWSQAAWVFAVAALVARPVAASPAPLVAAPALAGEFAARREAPARTYDVHHLKLEVTVDPAARRIAGEAALTLSPLVLPIATVTLHAEDLAVEAVSVIADRSFPELPYVVAPGRLEIALPRAFSPGETLIVRVRYHAFPVSGLFFVPAAGAKAKPQVWSQGEEMDNRFWYPAWDYPNDRATSELLVTVPAGLTAVGNGALVARRENPDHTVTFHWLESRPHVNYLFSIAIGDFAVIPGRYGEISLDAYVERGKETLASRTFTHTADMMRVFESAFGHPYPFEKYAQVTVADFLYGGMENVSATTLSDRTLHDEAAHLTFRSDDLVAHELAHSWFGNMITCRSWPHIWLNEGFCSYAEAVYFEEKWGEDGLAERLLAFRDGYLEEYGECYRRAIVTDRFAEAADLFDAHTYSKGGLVLHMLRHVLGDEVFWTALRRYVDRCAWREVDTGDFRRACEEASGHDLGVFFDQWLEHGGHPVLAASWSWDEELKQAVVEVEQVQGVDELTPLFDTPLDLRVTGASGPAADFRVHLAKERETFRLPAPARPRSVQIDPAGWLLAEIDFRKPAAEWALELAAAPEVLGRVAAARGLSGFPGDGAALAALGRALCGDPSRHVRAEAAKSLGALGTAAALDTLRAGTGDPDARVRLAVATALGDFRGEHAAAELGRLIARDPSPYVVGAAAEALGSTGGAGAFSKLESLTGRTAHANEIARGAVAGMAALEDEIAIPELLRLTGSGTPPEPRRAAIIGLGTLSAVFPERREELRARLTELLGDPSADARLAAIEALGECGDPDAIPLLRDLARNGRREIMRSAAGRAAWKLAQAEEMGEHSLATRLDRVERANAELAAEVERLRSRVGGESRPVERR